MHGKREEEGVKKEGKEGRREAVRDAPRSQLAALIWTDQFLLLHSKSSQAAGLNETVYSAMTSLGHKCGHGIPGPWLSLTNSY